MALAILSGGFGAGSAYASTDAKTQFGDLRVREERQESRLLYIEGAIGYVSLRRVGEDTPLVRRSFPFGRIRLDRRLRSGTYRLASWIRTCAGSCEFLSAPTRGCNRSFRVRPGAERRVTVLSEVGKRCRISLKRRRAQ